MIETSLVGISVSLEFLSKAFGAARAVHPGINSILPVNGPEYDHLLDAQLELHDIKTFQG